jgi:hypothetical protein
MIRRYQVETHCNRSTLDDITLQAFDEIKYIASLGIAD